VELHRLRLTAVLIQTMSIGMLMILMEEQNIALWVKMSKWELMGIHYSTSLRCWGPGVEPLIQAPMLDQRPSTVNALSILVDSRDILFILFFLMLPVRPIS